MKIERITKWLSVAAMTLPAVFIPQAGAAPGTAGAPSYSSIKFAPLAAKDLDQLIASLKALPDVEIVDNGSRFAGIPKTLLLRYTGTLSDVAINKWQFDQVQKNVLRPWCEKVRNTGGSYGSFYTVPAVLFRYVDNGLPSAEFFDQWEARAAQLAQKKGSEQKFLADYRDLSYQCFIQDAEKHLRFDPAMRIFVLDSALSRDMYFGSGKSFQFFSVLGRTPEEPRTVFLMLQTQAQIEATRALLAPVLAQRGKDWQDAEQVEEMNYKEEKTEKNAISAAPKSIIRVVNNSFLKWNKTSDWLRYIENSFVLPGNFDQTIFFRSKTGGVNYVPIPCPEKSRVLRERCDPSPKIKEYGVIGCGRPNKEEACKGGEAKGSFSFVVPKKVGKKLVERRYWDDGFVEDVHKPIYKGWTAPIKKENVEISWIWNNDGTPYVTRICWTEPDPILSEIQNCIDGDKIVR